MTMISSTILFLTVVFYTADPGSGEKINTENTDITHSCIFGVKQLSVVLYTRAARGGIIINIDSNRIPIDSNVSTIFLIHGFISEANTTNLFDLTETWLNQQAVNILAVDWKQGACTGSIRFIETVLYPAAVRNTLTVGEYVANFTKKLIDEYDIKVANIQLVGHSLGAHVAGFAGKTLKRYGWGIYPQITGLDPAGPAFEERACNERLCETDAIFVDVYHTSSLLGIHKPIGHNDFYFNGGITQPECIQISCSHTRVIIYFQEVIFYPNCKFLGRKWNLNTGFIQHTSACTTLTCVYVGPDELKSFARGTFYVATKYNVPYCSVF